jgi:hypothetical protein
MIQIIFHFLPVSYHGADQIKVLRENATLFAEGLGDRPGAVQLTTTGGLAVLSPRFLAFGKRWRCGK